MPRGAERLSQVVGQAADIGAGGAGDASASRSGGKGQQFDHVKGDRTCRGFDNLALLWPVVQAFAILFERRINRRPLFNWTVECGKHLFNGGGCEWRIGAVVTTWPVAS